MIRHRLSIAPAVAFALAFAAVPALAEPVATPPPGPITAAGKPGRFEARDTPLDLYTDPAAKASSIIYLERCKGGCTVQFGTNDARNNTSSIPSKMGASLVSEYTNLAGMTGDLANDEWNQLVKCMQEVYSPYAVTVTDVKPTSGLSYHEAMIAGAPVDLGLDDTILGIAPLASDCSAIDNVISFSFANAHQRNAERVNAICWTAAQESAHAFGLDHEYSFSNNRSACNDPMTYRMDCGGQKFFRNEVASCGELGGPRACKCGGTQNSHLKMLAVFGAGTPITGAPQVSLVEPAAGGSKLNAGVAATAGAQRGVSRVEIYFNGYKWLTEDGAPFKAQGQPFPSSYSTLVPSDLPNSIVDVKAIAYDDLGISGESAVVTVTKGAPCATADTCAKGQKCEAGKCFWDPPAGEIGASCAYPQFCKSALCTGTADQQICTQNCIPGSDDSCPSGLTCVAQTANQGVCFFQDSGGCCSTTDSTGWWAHGGIAALVLVLVTRRRRTQPRT
jgi:hypothetical protein